MRNRQGGNICPGNKRQKEVEPKRGGRDGGREGGNVCELALITLAV